MEFGKRMDSVKTIACALFVIVVAGRAVGDYDVRASDMVEGPRVERMHSDSSSGCRTGNCLLENSEDPVGAMWFGPRLGRRRRSDFPYSTKKIETLSDMITSLNRPASSTSDQSPWATSADDKRHEGPYIPRLGRELENALSTHDLVHQLLSHLEDTKSDQQQQQSPPMYASRMDRDLPTPKLEHELRSLLRKLQAI